MSNDLPLQENNNIRKKPFEETVLNKLKKKEMKKSESNTTRAIEDKDILSNESFLKKYQMQSSEISYDSYKEEKPILIDTLLENGERLQNNYINYPRTLDKKINFSLIKSSLLINEDNEEDKDEEEKKYLSDINEENYEPEIKNNKIRLKSRKKILSKLIDEEDLIEDKEFKKGYNSDNNNNKNKKGLKNNDSSENEFDPKFTENMLSNYKNTGKSSAKKRDKERNNLKNSMKSSLIISKHMTNENIPRKSTSKVLKKIRPGNSNIDDEDDEGNENAKNPINYTEFNRNEKKIAKRYIDGNGEIMSQDESGSSLVKKGNKSEEISKGSKEEFFRNSRHSKKNKSINKSKTKNKENKEKNFEFEEEGEINGDMAIEVDENNTKVNKRKKKRLLKNKDKNKDKDKIDLNDEKKEEIKEENIEKKSGFDIFREKVVSSSIASFVQQPIEQEEKSYKTFFKFYWYYFKKRELFIVCFLTNKESIPYFIRWSCFIFCLVFIFMLNCFFFFEPEVHDRFINAKNGGSNGISYYFKNEFVFCIYCSIINIIFKIIIIKLVLNRALKIKKEDKKMMQHSYENELTEEELGQIKDRRIKYLINYHMRLIIYFVAMFILSLFFAYICICYSEVFKNSISSILYGFLFSIIFSFFFCAVICLIIVCFYKTGKMFKNKCLFSTFVVLSTMY